MREAGQQRDLQAAERGDAPKRPAPALLEEARHVDLSSRRKQRRREAEEERSGGAEEQRSRGVAQTQLCLHRDDNVHPPPLETWRVVRWTREGDTPGGAQRARLDEEDVDKDHTDDAGDREEHTERAARGRRRELAETGGGRAGWLVVIPTPSILLSMPRKGKLDDVSHMEF